MGAAFHVACFSRRPQINPTLSGCTSPCYSLHQESISESLRHFSRSGSQASLDLAPSSVKFMPSKKEDVPLRSGAIAAGTMGLLLGLWTLAVDAAWTLSSTERDDNWHRCRDSARAGMGMSAMQPRRSVGAQGGQNVGRTVFGVPSGCKTGRRHC